MAIVAPNPDFPRLMVKNLTYYAKYSTKVSADPLNWIVALTFFTAAFFLILKGTATTALFLLFFICVFQIIKSPRYYLADRGLKFWIIILCLLSPFLAELLAQTGRGNFTGSSLDGPSRVILATGAFIYLSRRSCSNVLAAMVIGSGVGILFVFLYLQIFSEHYWGDRAATYFVDPITLPCYVVVLLGICLFSDLPNLFRRSGLLFKTVVTILTIYIMLESQSRSSWVAFLTLFFVYCLYYFRTSMTRQIFGILFLVFTAYVMFNTFDVIRDRTLNAYNGLQAFIETGEALSYQSSSQRMVLWQIDYELVKANPFFGVTDGVVPSYDSLKRLIPSLNEEVYNIKVLSGSHSEYSGELVRKGVFFGSFALWGLFFYPLYLVIRTYSIKKSLDYGLENLLGLLIPIFFSALTIQVFNLKMTISFYIMSLAIFLACHYYESQRVNLQK